MIFCKRFRAKSLVLFKYHRRPVNRAVDYMYPLNTTEDLTIESAQHGLPLLKYAADHWNGHIQVLSDLSVKYPDLPR